MMGPRRTAPSRQKVSFMPPDAAQPSANQNPDPPKDKMDAMASAGRTAPSRPRPPRPSPGIMLTWTPSTAMRTP